MSNNPQQPNKKDQNHAPGAGSDKHHPETPPDADERFQREKNKGNENKK